MATNRNVGLGSRMRAYLHLHSQQTLSPIFLVALLVAVEAWVRIFKIQPIIFAPPSAVFRAFLRGWEQGVYVENLLHTLLAAALGFAIAVVLGVSIGFVLVQFRLVEKIIYPYVVAVQSMPRIAIAPLFIIWLGFGISSKVAIASTVAFFPVLVNVMAGLRSVNPQMVNLMRSLAADRWQIFKMVTFPNSLPYLFAGLQIALVFSLLGAIVGEFIGAERGIGVLLVQMNFNMDVAGVFSVLILLMFVGLSLNYFLRWFQRRMVFWASPQDIQEQK